MIFWNMNFIKEKRKEREISTHILTWMGVVMYWCEALLLLQPWLSPGKLIPFIDLLLRYEKKWFPAPNDPG